MSVAGAGYTVHCLSLPTPFPVGPVNVYLLKGDVPVLVDTGPRTEDAWNALASGLRAHGLEVSDLRHVLITHGHLDHMGLLARVAEASGAEVWAHRYVARHASRYEAVEEEGPGYTYRVLLELGAPREAARLCARERATFTPYGEEASIGHALDDGDAALGFAVVHVPGHSASDTLFVDAAARRAFSGDHLLPRVQPNPLIRRPREGGARPKSLVEYQRSLRRTRALDLDACYPGHGEAIRDHRALIDRLLRRQEERTARVRALLADGSPRTPYQVSTELFPSLDLENLYLGVSVAVGHLEVLEERGEAHSDFCEGLHFYRVAPPA